MQSLALRRFLLAALSVSSLMLVAATTLPAQAARSLTFTFPRLSDGSVLPAGYGDIPNALSTEFSCEDGSRAGYWKDDYSDLDGLAYVRCRAVAWLPASLGWARGRRFR